MPALVHRHSHPEPRRPLTRRRIRTSQRAHSAFPAVPTPTGDTTTTTSTSKISDNNNSSNGSGCYNNYPCDSRGVLVDCLAGVGARTRPADPHHPLARSLGYGAIGAIAGY